jgi:hypothetical protein
LSGMSNLPRQIRQLCKRVQSIVCRAGRIATKSREGQSGTPKLRHPRREERREGNKLMGLKQEEAVVDAVPGVVECKCVPGVTAEGITPGGERPFTSPHCDGRGEIVSGSVFNFFTHR